MNNQFLLIDGSSYIFRAFYGVRAGLSSPDGTPTNAVFGFKNMLLQLLQKENPSHCVVVFDPKGKNFRHEMYPEYKANRGEAPDDLKPQFPLIHELVECFQFPMLVLDGVEADDVIGTLAEKYAGDIPVKIISGDKDLTQLVTDQVCMVDTMQDKVFTPESVKEKFGVKPDMIAQYLALVGDTSDNIPGATGVGAKTAVKLLNEHQDLEGIEQALDQVKGKLGEKLRDSWENVLLSHRLTQIKLDVEIPFQLDDFQMQEPDWDAVAGFYKKMGFRVDAFVKIQQEGEEEEADSLVDRSSYRLIQDLEELNQIAAEIQKEKIFAVDLETTSLNTIEAEIVGIALAWKDQAAYVPVAHQIGDTQLSRKDALKVVGGLLEDEAICVVAQNIKYEIQVFRNYDISLKGILEDTMLQSYVLNADTHQHSLDALAERFLAHTMIKYEEVTGKGKKQIGFDEVPLDKALEYAAEDADVTLKVYYAMKEDIKDDLLKVYRDIEMPLMKVLADVERKGISIDASFLNTLEVRLQEEADAIEKQIFEEAGESFNIGSPKQLGVILFEKMGISEHLKKTKTGYSTDASVLEKLSWKYPIAQMILEYRQKMKLINTYLSVLPDLVQKQTGRIHTSYNQAVAATGRLSSNNPNLQNIPIKGEDGRKIRSAFVAAEGYNLLAADYSQIELRLLAHISEDEGLRDAYRNGRDIHSETASAIFGIPFEGVTSDNRRVAKAINFGIVYGMGAYRLSQEIGVSNKEAKAFIDAYFERFPGIRTYMDKTIELAREKGFVETMYGRKRALPDINSKNHMARTGAERVAINSRIQGSAADLIKVAMIQIQDRILKESWDASMILQVHDELVFEVKEESMDDFRVMVSREMENAAELSVPLEVDAGVGKSWGEAHN